MHVYISISILKYMDRRINKMKKSSIVCVIYENLIACQTISTFIQNIQDRGDVS